MAGSDFPAANKVIDRLELAPGERLHRLLRIYYPILAVTVDMQERMQEDFEEIELLIEKLLLAGVTDPAVLSGLTGLQESDLRKFLRVLDGCAHVEVDKTGILRLTQLGRQSAERGQKLTRFTSQQVLLCDGLTGMPVPRELYRAVRQPPDAIQNNPALLMPALEFDPRSLQRVMTQKDRYHRNVVDEVEQIGAVHALDLTFMPAILAVTVDKHHRPSYRLCASPFLPYADVGSSVQELIGNEQEFPVREALEWLQKDEFPCESHDLELLSDGNVAVRIPGGRRLPDGHRALYRMGASPQTALSADHLIGLYGQGRLTYVWSPDLAIREQATVVQTVQLLQRLRLAGPVDKAELDRQRKAVADRLSVRPPELGALREWIHRSGRTDLEGLLGDLLMQ